MWQVLIRDKVIRYGVSAARVFLLAQIAVLAFGLGYLIRGEVKKSPIIIEKYSKD